MNIIQTSQQLIEQLEVLPWQKNNEEESKNLIQLLKLELLKDKTNFDTLTQNMDEGIAECQIICDKKGIPCDYRVLSVNKAFETHTGFEAHKILGKTILEIFPDMEKFWIDFYGEVALTQKPNSITRYNHNTKRHYTSSAYSSVKGEFTMLFKDVTESVELAAAHLEIEKNNEQSSAVLANMQEAFLHCKLIFDDRGIPIDYRFIYVNEAYKSQTGVTKNTLGKTILELFPDVEKSWIKILGQVALTKKPTSFVKFNHNTNKYYQVTAFSPAKEEFAAFLRDITDQETKRIELEKAYLKAAENDKLKSAFLANMSHEVRTPMNAILGFTSLLEDDTVSAEDKKTCLKQIKASGNRLLTIISDIVDISKIDANQQKLKLEILDLNQLLDELLKQYVILNTNANIVLKINKGSKSDSLTILADETRLNQILSNLIENALKFTQKGEVIFGYTIEHNHIQFYVRDTGVGIKKENQKLVFERFGQIENKTNIKVSGTGLGIPIAKGLVELFGGTIWVESKPKKGSTFYFTIPYKQTPEETTNLKYKNTILIAEDDDVNFLLLNLWLTNHFNIIRAKNGFEAIELHEKHDSIDIIIMDIKMPFMNGIEATKQIRKTDMYVPIIAHTAYAMNEESITIKMAGCDQVLIKPITRDTLLDVLAKYKVVI